MRVGIVGAGWVATDRHVPAYQRIPEVEIVGICDRSVRAGRRLANRLTRRPAVTTDLEGLIDTKPDLVSICTPPQMRRQVALTLIKEGIALFLEKPMAMNLAEATDIANAAAEAGVLVCVSHNFLFSRAMRRFNHWQQNGMIGTVTQIVGIQLSSPKRRLPSWYGELPGGLLFDEAPHLLYLMANILGDVRLSHVEAFSNEPSQLQPIATVAATFVSDAAPATLTMNFNSPVSEWHLAVVGTKAVVLLDLFRDVAIRVENDAAHRGRDILRTSLMVGTSHLLGVVASGGRVALRRQDWGHGELIRSVVAAVQTRSGSPIPLSDSLKVVHYLDELVAAIPASRK